MKNQHSKTHGIILMFLISVFSLSTFAEESKQVSAGLSNGLIKSITDAVNSDTERLQNIFKDIHQNPELGFMETRTAAIVAKELNALGYDVKTGIGTTGVVGIMKNGEGPTVMFRADMDAVAVEENTGLPYESKVRVKMPDGSESPVAHMCGHDAHTTWLISLAKTMATLKDQWSGTLVLVAQPAEELIQGGVAMAKDGLFTKHQVPKPQYLLAQHTAPLPTGVVVASGGLLQAGTEQLDVTFHGVGGHGSTPQLTKDPVLMGAYAVTQYQAIVSRVLDPRDTGVVTVGAFNAGINNNVIPEEATLKVNFRFFSENAHEQMYNSIESISNGIARTYGMPKDKFPTIVRKGYSSTLVNYVPLIERLNSAMIKSGVVNEKTLITEFKPITGSEDAHMLVQDLDDVKIGYIVIGSADPKLVKAAKAKGLTVPFANHNPKYKVDLNSITFGAKVAAINTLELLAK
jgi:hippurate hydrolase